LTAWPLPGNISKCTWIVFLELQRLDRFFTTRLLRRRYEFILPGKIKR
jgi:hypothetical protein